MATKKRVGPATNQRVTGKAKPKKTARKVVSPTAGKSKAGAPSAMKARRLTAKASARKTAKTSPAMPSKVRQPVPAPAELQKLTAKNKRNLKEKLLALRDALSGQIRTLKEESLKREDSVNSEEDGTDAFDRQFALSIVGAQQNSLLEVDDALRRLDEGTYGICESCHGAIEASRLEALPFVQTCITCQAEIERTSGVRRISPARRSL